MSCYSVIGERMEELLKETGDTRNGNRIFA
jgi:hypothetical protein